MRLNHIFVCSTDLEKSTHFYTELFGFLKTDIFPISDADNGQVLHKKNLEGDLDLLILPIKEKKLPYPHHIAFEVTEGELENLFERAKLLGFDPRSEVNLDSLRQIGHIHMNNKEYRNFFVLDPSRVNIEVMSCT